MRKSSVLVVVAVAVLADLAGCGGGSSSPPTTPPTPAVTPTPTPTPTPVAEQPAACQLKAPTVDCATRPQVAQELAAPLQAAYDAASTTSGVMYPGVNRIYDVMKFRTKVIDTLAKQNICGAFDYGDPAGTEIFVRSADGCHVEQYGAIASDGGIRQATKRSMLWTGDFSSQVPDPKPSYPKVGDLSCSLPGDRATYCFSIRNSPGEFGQDVYRLMTQVLAENPDLFEPDYFLPGSASGDPDTLKLPGWYIKDVSKYVTAVEAKLRANGYCAYVDEILRVKSVAKGNVLHEEYDIIQNPATGGDFTLFSVHDRCHDAGF
ncbi:MAG TPA: hypothetical protein VEQ10_11455 [Vicinamibacteria bacterium]|nr:hypothetical protein [Vicinamibacteria bacterium]